MFPWQILERNLTKATVTLPVYRDLGPIEHCSLTSAAWKDTEALIGWHVTEYFECPVLTAQSPGRLRSDGWWESCCHISRKPPVGVSATSRNNLITQFSSDILVCLLNPQGYHPHSQGEGNQGTRIREFSWKTDSWTQDQEIRKSTGLGLNPRTCIYCN